ncbi:rhodanese-like domain-containing protein 4A, chloroplastic [Euphorbia lathyris]|uniref:rhodanese-like domain-containing protein 4A, chloroplastic n=1 Tax=Euphorbia lathyris TaxID=212925 RepID=UPI003313CE2B
MVIMKSFSMILSSSPPILHIPTSKLHSHCHNFSIAKTYSSQSNLFIKTSFSFTTFHLLTSLPSLASETLTPSTDQLSEKISFDSILVPIDDFFTRYPFFVAGCTFIWLVVIPVTKQYLRKYKFISAIDAFRKLKEDKDAQLLDIRDTRSLMALGGSPNLKILNKNAVQVQFSDEDEDGFVKNVLEIFPDPENTSLCILDDFDGNSLKAATLLYKKGFKEAYGIRGGVRGKKGWLAIQETLLPPSVHINPKKKKKSKVSQLGTNGGVSQKSEENNGNIPSVAESQRADNGHVNKSMISTPHTKIDCRSPYPKYPDLKPPSSPTPSKP